MKSFLNCRAFTLAELMAVVVIIAILAGIAIGSYRRSVDRARFSEALSLAHQIAAARDVYYYDLLSVGQTGSMPTSFGNLSLELGVSSGSTYNGNNFTLSISNANYVKATHKDGHYGLCVYQEATNFGNVPRDKCLGLTDDGKEFCQSMGYTPASGC